MFTGLIFRPANKYAFRPTIRKHASWRLFNGASVSTSFHTDDVKVGSPTGDGTGIGEGSTAFESIIVNLIVRVTPAMPFKFGSSYGVAVMVYDNFDGTSI